MVNTNTNNIRVNLKRDYNQLSFAVFIGIHFRKYILVRYFLDKFIQYISVIIIVCVLLILYIIIFYKV